MNYPDPILRQEREKRKAVRFSSQMLWQKKYNCSLSINEDSLYENKKYNLTGSIAMEYMQNQSNQFFVFLQKKYSPIKKKNKSWNTIEELNLLLGKHSQQIIYQTDGKGQLEKIANYSILEKKWNIDLLYAENTYRGKPAELYINATNQSIRQPEKYLNQKLLSFPDGLLLQMLSLLLNREKTTITTSLFPKKFQTFTLHKKNDQWYGETKQLFSRTELLCTLPINDNQLPVKLDSALVNQVCSIIVKTSDDSSWQSCIVEMKLSCEDYYQKIIRCQFN